ncbi:MAG: acetate kinase [Bacteroidetes bacterium]|nr:MAG: acetate kinase [Bacteroidota bacterium]
MKVLVINCGSSSIKYQLFNMKDESVLASGLVDKVGLNGSYIKNVRSDGDKVKLEGNIFDHQQGIEYVLGVLTSEKHGSIKDLKEIEAVGHRVVHGGEEFNGSVSITDEVISTMEDCVELAPLHNPPNLKGIYAVNELMPGTPQCGVFDTAFHQTMEAKSYMYAIPYALYKKHGIRRYGFHGSSHKFVSQRLSEISDIDINNSKIITCHLGNGASIAAIKNGKSVDTSMGMTPVEGLMMGTRTGDLDVGALTFIMNKEDIGLNATNTLVNKHSGVLGVSGVSSDMREVEEAAEAGNERAILALRMYEYRIKKYIGAYAAIMGGVDAIVFTGGIGENADETRENVLDGLEFLGINFNNEANKGLRGKEINLCHKDSKVQVWVIPTNEELVIARDTIEILENK